MTDLTGITCTVVKSAVYGVCGKPAVWTDGRFAECAECAKDPSALARMGERAGGPSVGDTVTISRYGKTYPAKVVEVGTRGAVYVEWTYGNGATRRARWDG